MHHVLAKVHKLNKKGRYTISIVRTVHAMHHVLAKVPKLNKKGRYTVSIVRTFPLDIWSSIICIGKDMEIERFRKLYFCPNARYYAANRTKSKL